MTARGAVQRLVQEGLVTESRYVGARYGLDGDFEVELPG
jgi:hypothetical protein